MKVLKSSYNGFRTDYLVEHWKNNTEQIVFMNQKEREGNQFYKALFQLMSNTGNKDWQKLNQYTDSVWIDMLEYGGYGSNDTLRLNPDFKYVIEEESKLNKIINLFKR